MKRREILFGALITGAALVAIAFLQRLPRSSIPSLEDLDSGQPPVIQHVPEPKLGGADDRLLMMPEPLAPLPDSGLIQLEDRTFSAAYDEIYENRDRFYGRALEFSGYVIADDLPPGQFLVGRDLIWCCEADQYFIGFLVITEGSLPKTNDEVRVTGTLEPVPYDDPETGNRFMVPALRLETLGEPGKFSRQVFP